MPASQAMAYLTEARAVVGRVETLPGMHAPVLLSKETARRALLSIPSEAEVSATWQEDERVLLIDAVLDACDVSDHVRDTLPVRGVVLH
jgi:hypothetical protein